MTNNMKKLLSKTSFCIIISVFLFSFCINIFHVEAEAVSLKNAPSFLKSSIEGTGIDTAQTVES